MSRRALLLLTMGATFALAACYQASSYKGDGRLVDKGSQLKGGRYELDLGPIDVSRAGKYSFKLKSLPDAEFVIGIELLEAAPNRDNRPNHKVDVRLDLKETGGHTVVTEAGLLENWTWSHGLGDIKSFLYRRGASKEIASSSGATEVQRVVNATGGWGSYFTADGAKEYELTLQILASETQLRPARLLLRSVDI